VSSALPVGGGSGWSYIFILHVAVNREIVRQ